MDSGGIKEPEPIAIAYCGDQGMFRGFLLSSLSVASTTDRAIHFYFLTGDATEINPVFAPLSSRQAAFIEASLRQKNPRVSVELVDCTDVYRHYLAHSRNVRTFYSPYSLFRLVMDFLPLPDKVLYLDADVVAVQDIGPLYDTDIASYDLAMVKDAVGHRFLGWRYGNSGVLLLNLKAIRNDGLMAKAREIVNHVRLFMPDQTALNIVFRKKKRLLEKRFNDQTALAPETVLRHYCKRLYWFPFPHTINVKPWDGAVFQQRFGNLHQELLQEFAALETAYSLIPNSGEERL